VCCLTSRLFDRATCRGCIDDQNHLSVAAALCRWVCRLRRSRAHGVPSGGAHRTAWPPAPGAARDRVAGPSGQEPPGAAPGGRQAAGGLRHRGGGRGRYHGHAGRWTRPQDRGSPSYNVKRGGSGEGLAGTGGRNAARRHLRGLRRWCRRPCPHPRETPFTLYEGEPRSCGRVQQGYRLAFQSSPGRETGCDSS